MTESIITPDSGWYDVQGLDIRGLNTQGRTIEEAIYMTHDAAQALAESREIMAKETAKKAKAAAKMLETPRKAARRSRPAKVK